MLPPGGRAQGEAPRSPCRPPSQVSAAGLPVIPPGPLKAPPPSWARVAGEGPESRAVDPVGSAFWRWERTGRGLGLRAGRRGRRRGRPGCGAGGGEGRGGEGRRGAAAARASASPLR